MIFSGAPRSPSCSGSDPSETAECGHLTAERWQDYTLLFAEFDDEGWLVSPHSSAIAFGYEPVQPATKTSGAADGSYVPRDTIGDIKSTLRDVCDPTLVVVFIHGWKHSAAFDDENVRSFRQELESLAQLENKRAEVENRIERKVIGIYIGWRGAPFLAQPPLASLENLTFFQRKSAAENVARGSVQELLAFVTEFERGRNLFHTQCTRPTRGDILPVGAVQCESHWCNVSNIERQKQVQTIFIGHSFGGLILFEATVQPLLTYIVDGELDTRDDIGEKARLALSADLVVLLNPAVEASRFEPLYRAMRGERFARYFGPRTIAITSTADTATGDAFPITRYFSDSYESEDKRTAYSNTIGHAPMYFTHTLEHFADCTTTQNVAFSPGPLPETDSACIGGSELRLAAQTDSVGRNDNGCGNYREFWNISAAPEIMIDHNDILNEKLRSFVNAFALDLMKTQSDTTFRRCWPPHG
ncbi:hypothetical protein [Paraburkholderia sp. WP4_3_2]|uniref:hypothetical protein n=1 Tax=Paraburkholderia sp. WP4_3_2 TaxID=2587162 RepID=UPI00161561D2|nr:hypothetical protein [Paraburkholderia sp. WP4_3_2]MBB3261329.1 hypothetical protein [Paraburkholderia sp. WP4_3_2]